ncbi:MAG: sensor histidine kinase [Clostridia bacterium]|nr:sensor histidine kinase [Clostridia bacterium]
MFISDDLINLMAVGIGCLIPAKYLEKRSHYPVRVAAGFLAVMLWMYVTRVLERQLLWENWMLIGTIRFAGVFVLYGLMVAFWCKALFCQALFAVTVSYSLQNLCERLIEIPRFTAPQFFPELLDKSCLIGLMALTLFMYARACSRRSHERSMFDFSRMNSRLMLFLGTGTIVATVWLDLEIRSRIVGSGDPMLFVSLNLMAALFSILTVVVSMSHLRETDSERRAEISTQLLRSQQRRYEHDKMIHEAINVRYHDIKHQIAALGEQAYAGELKKIEKLVDIYDTKLNTRNAALNVILSGKMLDCNNQGITLTCMADGRRMDFMEDSDIYALFGNILDNAIEAVRTLEAPDERLISLTVTTQGELLRIEEENFFSGHLVFAEGLPITTKGDTTHHGFGTRSIRMLTEKYNGDFKISIHDNIFSLSIILPIPPKA